MSLHAKSDFEPRYATRAVRMRSSEIRELLKLLDQPGVISFAGGIPDPALFPVDMAKAAYDDILSNAQGAAQGLQYSASEGYAPLRDWVVAHMAERGVTCTPDNIVMTNGSQQALEFLGRLLLSPNDTALVEAPTYLGALQAFSAYEPRYDTIAPENSNRTPASYLEAASAVGGTAKFAYVVPDFANPTGVTMSLAARQRLLALARELDIPVLEDTAYVALRFEGSDMPSLQSLDVAQEGSIDRSRVAYLGTFSKTMTPGLRTGWICASAPLVRRLVLIKQASDLNSPAINQMVMQRMASAIYDAQVMKARVHYRAKRDAMLAALSAHMPKGVTWTRPEGGLFVWVTMPPGIDAAALLKRAVAEARIAFVPGHAFFNDGSGRNTMRLSYSLPSLADIDAGIARLGKLIGESVA
ncbi:MAG: PLP-dependent aminotransferase family protein [Hyphomicrobiaceae bacterium]